MRDTILAVLLVGAMTTAAFAQARPLNAPPQPGANPTANLVLDAMLASARAAATNPTAAKGAMKSYQQALQSYNTGDDAGARNRAIQSIIQANRQPDAPISVQKSTIPQGSALQINPFPLAGGSVAQIDAQAFVAQARGAVANCGSTRSPNAQAATSSLATAQHDLAAGRYVNVRVEARTAIDLCAKPSTSAP